MKVIGSRIGWPPGFPSGTCAFYSGNSPIIVIVVSCVYIFTAAYGVSYGPIGWVLPSEVFPLSVRSKGVSLSTASNWFNNCASSPSAVLHILLTNDIQCQFSLVS